MDFTKDIETLSHGCSKWLAARPAGKLHVVGFGHVARYNEKYYYCKSFWGGNFLYACVFATEYNKQTAKTADEKITVGTKEKILSVIHSAIN